jgi:hypothetical protein
MSGRVAQAPIAGEHLLTSGVRLGTAYTTVMPWRRIDRLNHHVDTTIAPPVTNTEITERVHT